MRGIEGALFALRGVREGKTAAETLRTLGSRLPVKELSLASSLVYMALRREAAWRRIFTSRLRKGRSDNSRDMAPLVSDCLLLGTAGLLELRHFAGGVLVNGLLEALKDGGQAKAVPLVNAILHYVSEHGGEEMEKLRRSPNLEDRALWAGIPVWSLPAWKKSWTAADLNELFDLMRIAPCASLRTSPGEREGMLATLAANGVEAAPSELFPDSVRLASTILPTLVPGFSQGRATVQTEGSMLAASLVKEFWRGGLIVDMCSGRGVKAAQIAQSLPDSRVECWELSSGRHLAAVGEMNRLGVASRVALRVGDALTLSPSEKPTLVFLDAPCSGSGTWNRKPESKWKLNWMKLDKICESQSALLRRALTLTGAGGIIIYVTCSLLRQENENIVASVLSEHPDCVVLDVPWRGNHLRRGRPWGVYIWPNQPWLDGFYVSVIMKRAEA
ncbi:MAG: RsmB/NOP family class I SAM-dependent RNA methyltransferase [Synergistaceae bacterium]|nr:RsmB/NOP family class I SAM-dependent RNA methyltransferase [Synergistaceae bacterium]